MYITSLQISLCEYGVFRFVFADCSRNGYGIEEIFCVECAISLLFLHDEVFISSI